MKFISGITGKLFGWYFIFVLIFYGTVFILYGNIHQMMKISENIINRNYKLSSASKNMIENLLNMEENEKKYLVLKKEEYLNYFFSAQKEFEKSLSEISEMELKAMAVSPNWKAIREDYAPYFLQAQDIKSIRAAEKLWIPESAINEWIGQISLARADNEREIEIANLELNLRGQLAVRSGLIGMGISTLVGLLGGMMLAHSMVRPLRELLNGIRSISEERQSEPIRIRSKDEFGELANAFNEMAFRLKEEQKMRSDFISMLSHEIRTPLTSIRESVNLIAEGIMGTINDRQRKFLEIASLEIGRVCELLNRMMQVSCLESGAFNIRLCPLSPEILVSGCPDQIKAAAESKGIIIETDISHNLPNVMGDAKYLQQVLGNLLGNAIKFSPAGSRVNLKIGMNDNQLVFTVSDNGPGIPTEEQAFIFNKYYRAKGVRDHQDGMGLGLSITKHIVEAHGGIISLKSTVGQGTTFEFTLPVAKNET